jgi:hypothetical protein
MMSELEAILGDDRVTMVFLYGSAAMLILAMIAVTWLTERRQILARERQAAQYKVAAHRN